MPGSSAEQSVIPARVVSCCLGEESSGQGSVWLPALRGEGVLVRCLLFGSGGVLLLLASLQWSMSCKVKQSAQLPSPCVNWYNNNNCIQIHSAV